jgi:tRNA (guanine26-N2/guanine27-N2)-dimethyltransferase
LELVKHLEGGTQLLVPKASLTTVPPPTSPVFFNPAAALNRDVTVALAAAHGGRTFCDAMAGTGARGVRVAKETRAAKVVMVDFNGEALALARRSAALNRVSRRCSFKEAETSSYLFSRFGRDQRFDFVDLDPFGTPVRQLQAGLFATAEGGILSVTATDTAVLCGVHRATCERRYGAVPLNNSFHHETGIRILLGSMARTGAAVDVGIEPVAAHATRHYIRVFAEVRPGAMQAEASLKSLGYVSWCPACGDVSGGAAPARECAACGKKPRSAGPAWTGGLTHESVVEAARTEAARRGLEGASEVLGSLRGVDGFPPWSFDLDAVSSLLGVPTVPELRVYGALLEQGHRAMRTPFEKAGVKTDASFAEVVEAAKVAASPEGRTGGRRV